MSSRTTRADVDAAIQDIKHRTLAKIPGEFARLIYLASTRDYNTGRYSHEGLCSRFTPEVSVCALALCHEESFKRLVCAPLSALIDDFKNYITSTRENASDVLEAWKKLEPFRVAIPMEHEPLEAELFMSNVRVALAVLGSVQGSGSGNRQSA